MTSLDGNVVETGIIKGDGCNCNGVIKNLTLITKCGTRMIKVMSCEHHETHEILIENGYWPTTPVSICVAIDIDILKNWNISRKVARISLQKCIDVLAEHYASQPIYLKGQLDLKKYYGKIRECVYQFEYAYFSIEKKNSGCVICMDRNSTLPFIFSVDACFQIQRKKTSGEDHRKPLICDIFLEYEEETLVTENETEQMCETRVGNQRVRF